MKIIISLLALSFLFSLAQADILFIDLNGSSKEVDAARRAAAQRSEKLIVIPAASAAAKAEIKNLSNKLNQIRSESERCNTATERCANLLKEETAIQNRFEVLREQNRLSNENLNAQLKVLKNQKTSLSSLIISGHDGNGHFNGEYGDFSDRKLSEAFQDAAPLGENIRSLMLWGCYTTNIGSLTNHWKKAFPNVEMIAGYDAVAPSGEKVGSSNYLEDVLIQEKKLTAIKDERALQKAFKGLKSVQQMNASLCVDDRYVSNKLALKLSESQKICGSMMDQVKSVYACYLHAQKPQCANPPRNTSSGELRSAYNKLQESRHCFEFNQQDGMNIPGTPSPDVLIRLIFFDQVKRNFARAASTELKKFDSLMKEIKAPEKLLLGNLESLNRADLLAELNSVGDYLMQRQKDGGPWTPEVQVLLSFFSQIQNILGDLNVPFGWIEPNARTNDIMLAKLDVPSIQMARTSYEQSRATKVVSAKLLDLLNESPSFKTKNSELLEGEKQIAKELEQLKRENDQNPDQGMNPAQQERVKELYMKKSRSVEQRDNAIRQGLSSVQEKLIKFQNELKLQDYPNVEGKKAFAEALDKIETKRLIDALKFGAEW